MSKPTLSSETNIQDKPPNNDGNWIQVCHRYRTEWVRTGDPVAFTPGCGLDEANAHLFPESKSEHSDELLPLRPLKRYEENTTWEAACVKVTGTPVILLLDDDPEKTAVKKNDK
jgi:hypothetical protein